MFKEKPAALSKKSFNWQLLLFIILALVGLAAVVFGLYSLTTFSNQSFLAAETIPEASNSAFPTSPQGYIYVDLAGAVKTPGIYQLAVGSRLATVIDEAGGFTVQADLDYIAQDLNLAQKLKDGAKIYIISQVETDYQQTAVDFCQSLSAAPTQDSGTSTGQISINSASAEDLESLEGIGEKRAGDIMAGRPYQSLQELVEREVLTANLFSKIKNQLKL